MRREKQLLELYNKINNKDSLKYYSFEDFKSESYEFIKDLRGNKNRVILHIDASQSGMSRKMNFLKYNNLFNIVYNNKHSYNAVKVGGCGMDMVWHLLYTVSSLLVTEKEWERWHLNNKCSSYITL